MAARAEELSTLRTKSDVDSRVRRARLLLMMDHLQQSREQYRALQAELPHDARAATGLARIMVQEALWRRQLQPFTDAARLLDDPQLNAQKDREYYDLVLELHAFLFVQPWVKAVGQGPAALESLAAQASQVAARARELEPFDVARATTMRYFFDTLAELLRLGARSDKDKVLARVRQAFDETRTLRRRFPESVEAAQLSLAAAFFADNEQAAFEVVEAPLPATLRSDAAAVYHRALMHFGLVAIFRASSRLGRLEQLSKEVDANDGVRALDRATLQADIRALSARLGTGSWLPVAEGYMSASNLTVGPEHFRLISNASMAIWQSDGNKNLAQRAWAEVSTKAGQDAAVPTLCLAATEPDHAKAIALLEPLSNSDSTGIQALVRAWLAAREQRRGSPVRARKLASEWAETMTHVPPSRQALTSGDGGLAIVRAMTLTPPLRQRSEFLRFAPDVTIEPTLWLVFPAPLDAKAMQALAGGR